MEAVEISGLHFRRGVLVPVLKLPDRIIGSKLSPFLTWSDSPVNDDSSIFKSLLWIKTPSAGSKSPYFICNSREVENYTNKAVILFC